MPFHGHADLLDFAWFNEGLSYVVRRDGGFQPVQAVDLGRGRIEATRRKIAACPPVIVSERRSRESNELDWRASAFPEPYR